MQQRHALGALFVVLAAVFALIALASARAGQWVIAAAALALGLWLGSTAARALGRRRTRR